MRVVAVVVGQPFDLKARAVAIAFVPAFAGVIGLEANDLTPVVPVQDVLVCQI